MDRLPRRVAHYIARRLSLVMAYVATYALVAACDTKKSEAPKADPATAPSVVASASGAPEVQRVVTREDCAAWADHAVPVLIQEWVESASACPEDDRTMLSRKLEGARKDLRDSAVAVCAKHAGEAYSAKDGRCYLDGKSMKQLYECKLGAMTTPGDSDLTVEFAKQRALCASGAAPSTSSSAKAVAPR